MEFNKEYFSEHHKNLKFLIWVLVAFLIVLTISGAVGINNKIKEGKYIGQDVMVRNTFTVTDSAEVYAKPDLGLVNFSVVTESRIVANAMKDNTEKMNNIISYLKESGVDEKDLKTTAFNIYPQYNYTLDSRQRVLSGYQITQSLQVKIRDLSKTGDLIAGVTDKGANQIGSLSFIIDNQDELKEQARVEAIKKAENKAEKIAKDLGVNIVSVVNFSENNQIPMYYDYAMSEKAMGGGGGSPEIETGENKIEVFVSITYEIN